MSAIFMTKPAKLWADADLETRQAFQATMFPNDLHFDIKSKKFGNVKLSPLYRVISNKKESNSDSDSHMVIPAGVEPAIFWMRTRRPRPLDDGTNTTIIT